MTGLRLLPIAHRVQPVGLTCGGNVIYFNGDWRLNPEPRRRSWLSYLDELVFAPQTPWMNTNKSNWVIFPNQLLQVRANQKQRSTNDVA